MFLVHPPEVIPSLHMVGILFQRANQLSCYLFSSKNRFISCINGGTKKSKLLQKQIAHVSQDVADPNLLYLQYGWSAFDIGLVQDIEVEWALKYLN